MMSERSSVITESDAYDISRPALSPLNYQGSYLHKNKAYLFRLNKKALFLCK